MKKTLLLLHVVALSATAQIKIHNTNQISLGYTSTVPAIGIKTHAIGNTLFTTTSAGTAGALIRGNDGVSSISNPDYTWNGDLTTGIFHPSPGNFGFTINGEDLLKFTSYKKAYLGCNPSANLWEDGRLTISPIANTAEAAIKVNADHGVDYGKVVDVFVSRANTVGYRTTVTGSGAGTGWYVVGAGWMVAQSNYIYSDSKLKDNITQLESSLGMIKKIKGVSYKLKSELENPKLYGTAKLQYGFIAQDLEKIFPGSDVVKEVDGGIKAVNYSAIIPFLVEAIKEQQTQIEKLESEITKTKNISTSINEVEGIKATLYQNIPNPFSEKTEIKYSIPTTAKEGTLYVYNMNGLQIMSFPIKEKGNGSIVIEGSRLESGMYLYSLIVDNQEVETKRMILTK